MKKIKLKENMIPIWLGTGIYTYVLSWLLLDHGTIGFVIVSIIGALIFGFAGNEFLNFYSNGRREE